MHCNQAFAALCSKNWAVNEFGSAPLGDRRLVKRLISLATDFAEHPTAPIPQACGEWRKTKGAYRFLDNDSVEPQALLAAHARATLERMQAHRVVLCPQDTTSLNYSSHPRTRQLGPIGNNRDKTLGLFVHSTLALTPEGEPLGLLHLKSWARSQRTFGRSSQARNRAALQDKESYKWMESFEACRQAAVQSPQTLLVSLADREGDLYELFAAALAPNQPARAHVLVRAQHNRQVLHPQQYLWDLLGARPLAGHFLVQVPRKEGQPKRRTRMEIRFVPLILLPPCLKEGQEPLSLWGVEAREEQPPPGGEPICWRLLTTLAVENLASAIQMVGWYAQRWQIEVLHKVLKSGCRVERRQLESAARLKRVLTLDLIVAWRIMALDEAARHTPQREASHWLRACEWQALCCYMNRTSHPPATAPTIRQAVLWIARLGGFLGRKSDGEPGPIVLWRGLQQLQAITQAWERFGAANCG